MSLAEVWVSAGASLVGALLGASVPAYVAVRAARREHQWRVGEILGPARRLLDDLRPDTRLLGMGPPDYERELWGELKGRLDKVSTELYVLSTGSDDSTVSDLANRLAGAIQRTFTLTRYAVLDLLANRDNATQRADALREHGEASALVEQLKGALDAAR